MLAFLISSNSEEYLTKLFLIQYILFLANHPAVFSRILPWASDLKYGKTKRAITNLTFWFLPCFFPHQLIDWAPSQTFSYCLLEVLQDTKFLLATYFGLFHAKTPIQIPYKHQNNNRSSVLHSLVPDFTSLNCY